MENAEPSRNGGYQGGASVDIAVGSMPAFESGFDLYDERWDLHLIATRYNNSRKPEVAEPALPESSIY